MLTTRKVPEPACLTTLQATTAQIIGAEFETGQLTRDGWASEELQELGNGLYLQAFTHPGEKQLIIALHCQPNPDNLNTFLKLLQSKPAELAITWLTAASNAVTSLREQYEDYDCCLTAYGFAGQLALYAGQPGQIQTVVFNSLGVAEEHAGDSYLSSRIDSEPNLLNMTGTAVGRRSLIELEKDLPLVENTSDRTSFPDSKLEEKVTAIETAGTLEQLSVVDDGVIIDDGLSLRLAAALDPTLIIPALAEMKRYATNPRGGFLSDQMITEWPQANFSVQHHGDNRTLKMSLSGGMFISRRDPLTAPSAAERAGTPELFANPGDGNTQRIN